MQDSKRQVVITVVIIACVVVLIAVASAFRPKTLNEKLKDLKLNVPKSSVDAVSAGIEEGMRIAQNEYEKKQEIRKQIEDETQEMKDMLESAIAD